MTIAFKTLKPGDTLYDCSKDSQDTSTVKVLPIKVFEVNVEQSRALISWNGTQVRWRYASYFNTPQYPTLSPRMDPTCRKRTSLPHVRCCSIQRTQPRLQTPKKPSQ